MDLKKDSLSAPLMQELRNVLWNSVVPTITELFEAMIVVLALEGSAFAISWMFAYAHRYTTIDSALLTLAIKVPQYLFDTTAAIVVAATGLRIVLKSIRPFVRRQ